VPSALRACRGQAGVNRAYYLPILLFCGAGRAISAAEHSMLPAALHMESPASFPGYMNITGGCDTVPLLPSPL